MPVRLMDALESVVLQEVCTPFMMSIISYDFISLHAKAEQFHSGKGGGKGKMCLVFTGLSGKIYEFILNYRQELFFLDSNGKFSYLFFLIPVFP